MKPAVSSNNSASSSSSSSSSSTTSLSSAGNNNKNNSNNLKKNASGSFKTHTEKSLSLSSSSSTSTSSQESNTVDTSAGNSSGPSHQQLNQLNQSASSSASASPQTPSGSNEDDEPPISPHISDFLKKLTDDYDTELEKIADRATDAVSKGSFFDFGFFQFVSFLFISIAWTVGNGWYAYVSVFTGYTPDHECDYEQMGGNLTRLPLNHSLLVESDDPTSVKNCWAYEPNSNQTVKCTHWKFDKSQMHSTIITEYGFVCDKNYYFEMAYSLEQIGYIVGTLVFSFIADLVGRKPVMVAVLWSMSICGFLQYFVDNFIVYIVVGFVINSLACGLEAVCVTLVLEMFSTSKRTIFGVGIQVVWVIVLASMSPLAYFVKLWREIRLIIFATLAVLSIFSSFLVQESIRWLISISRLDTSMKVIDRVAVFNRLRWTDSRDTARSRRFETRRKKLAQMFIELDTFNRINNKNGLTIKSESSTSSSSSSIGLLGKPQLKLVLEMFKNCKFRLYVLIMALNWFATALVYDGLAYLNNFIGENIFLNWIVMNLIELPAQFVCYYLISRSGRRVTVAITLVISGCVLLATLVVEFCESQLDKSYQNILSWVKLILFVLAKFVITQSYSAIIVHAPELFPTSLRSFGYGICLFSGKITAVLSPIISFYVSKIAPSLPAIIYGSLSILCGLISLYVPETLNRPLPNSVDDVVKWPRSLSADEWKVVKKLNDNELKLMFKCCYKLKTSKRTAPAIEKKKSSASNDSEQQKCMYGAKNGGQIVVIIKNASSSAVLVEDDQEQEHQEPQETIVI